MLRQLYRIVPVKVMLDMLAPAADLRTAADPHASRGSVKSARRRDVSCVYME